MDNFIDTNLDILNKQQYYVSFCHKLCEEYLNYSNLMKCLVCESNHDMDFGIHTKWMFSLPIFQECKIRCLQEFHDVYEQFNIYLANNKDRILSKIGFERSHFLFYNANLKNMDFKSN